MRASPCPSTSPETEMRKQLEPLNTGPIRRWRWMDEGSIYSASISILRPDLSPNAFYISTLLVKGWGHWARCPHQWTIINLIDCLRFKESLLFLIWFIFLKPFFFFNLESEQKKNEGEWRKKSFPGRTQQHIIYVFFTSCPFEGLSLLSPAKHINANS